MRYMARSDTPKSAHLDTRSPRSATGPRDGSTDVGPERAVLVGVLLPSSKVDFREPLAELAALAESTGVEIVDAMVQKRTTLATATCLGKGKVQELTERVQAGKAGVVIFDNDLTARQIRALEERVGCKIIDRSELILDIFAARARTREAQLQVELAQLEYTAPRLRGMWTHLERIAGAGGATAAGNVGGVGTRGPGERQIEMDRRVVKKRISRLRREIEEIDRRKEREVKSRSDQYTVSLVGYTNSGKTTLLNRLTDSDQFAAGMLFATLDTKTVRWDLGDGRSALLSDTVGFVRDLPHNLIASFRATLEEAIHAHLLLHVVDVSSPTALQQVEAVNEVLKGLGCGERSKLTLLNKIDAAEDLSYATVLEMREPQTLRISALTGEGLDTLAAQIGTLMAGQTVDVDVLVPHAAGKALADVDRHAVVRGREFTDQGVCLRLRLSRSHLNQLTSRYPMITVVEPEQS